MNSDLGSVRLTVDAERHVAELVLDRPHKLNAITRPMESELFAHLDRIRLDRDVACVVLRGEGRAFCAGYDLVRHVDDAVEETGETLPESAFDDWFDFRATLRRWLEVRNLPVPIVAAIHGHCYGIATVLGSMCDLVVIADDARWGAAQVRAGGGSNGTTLACLIGQRKAREIEYRAGQLTGREAVEIGWANYAVPAAEVTERAWALAVDVALTPREALIAKKASFNSLQDHQGFTQYLDDAALLHTVLSYSAPVKALRATIAAEGLSTVIPRSAPAHDPSGGGAT